MYIGWVSLLHRVGVGSSSTIPLPRCTSSWTRTMTKYARMCWTYLFGAGHE